MKKINLPLHFWGVILLLTFIEIGGFLLSFFNLSELAIKSGIHESIAWLFPCCIDSFLLAGCAIVLFSSISRKKCLRSRMVVILFTGISIFFNIANCSDVVLFKMVFAFPPIAQCTVIEMTIWYVRSNFENSYSFTPRKEVILQNNSLDDLDALEGEKESLFNKGIIDGIPKKKLRSDKIGKNHLPQNKISKSVISQTNLMQF